MSVTFNRNKYRQSSSKIGQSKLSYVTAFNSTASAVDFTSSPDVTLLHNEKNGKDTINLLKRYMRH